MAYTTVEQIRDLYKKYFYLTPETEVLIDATIAISLATKLPGDSIWLMIVGAPSSGKTEMVNILLGNKHAHQVSTLTENTFLSSMRSHNGKEMSLLHRIGPRGLMIMKDYTSIMSMSTEKREAILAQLREIFDGFFKKESGNGVNVEWKGKINAIFCVTDAIYTKGGESAAMGRRSMMYELPALEDDMKIEMGRTRNKLNKNINDIRQEIQDATKEFIEYKLENLPEEMPVLTPDVEEELLQMSLLVTKARTAVERDWRGTLIDINESEGITRFNSQITKTLEVMLYIGNKQELDKEYLSFGFKTGLDSIPRTRRRALMVLSEYRAVTARGAAMATGMTTEAMKMALEELTAHRLVERRPNPAGIGADHWILKDKYKFLMQKYADINTSKSNEVLNVDDVDTDVEISDSMKKIMGIGDTDDVEFNKEIEAAKQRKDNQVLLSMRIDSKIQDLKDRISKKKFELNNLDWAFLRDQSEAKAKVLNAEISQLENAIAELEKQTKESVEIQSTNPLEF